MREDAGEARPEGLRVGHRDGRDRRGLPHRRRGRGLPPRSATSRSRPSSARTTASCARPAQDDLPELVELGDAARRPALPHRRLGRQGARSSEMVEAARAAGLEYLAVTDHSAGVGMGIGLEADDAAAPRRADPRARRRGARRPHAAGRRRGRRHGRRQLVLRRRAARRARLGRGLAARRAAAGPRPGHERGCWPRSRTRTVDVLGHPSGRLLGRREGYDFDVERGGRARRRTGTFLEINCRPHRLDLRPAPRAAAIDAGVQARHLHRRPPAGLVRAPRPRRGHGPPGLGDRRRRRQHPPGRSSSALRKRMRAPAVGACTA